ncbi:MAG TPA: DUF6029 family protein [Polyangiaceae bacterium]|nr:DUF6029 family protein [Polyangiaceae bacterium]
MVRRRKVGSRGRVACAAAALFWVQQGRAADVGQVGGDQVQLDVTETTVAVQHFDARDNELPQNSGWGQWLNRLNAALRWGKWTAGMRLDSAVYWRRPVDNPNFSTQQIQIDNESRYENAIYPAKLWITYSRPSIEVTAGDAYVQFGRGLTLSMRKIDELGIDTTVRGVKVQVQKDPFAITMVAGFANPSRIDEATGRSLFPTHDLVEGDRALPVFGSDRIVGIDVQAGRGLPVTLSTHVSQFTRCAPYHYDAGGSIVTDPWQSFSSVAFGTCDAADTVRWLQQLGNTPPPLGDGEITMVGQSLEVPRLWGHGKLYVEVAGQDRRNAMSSQNGNGEGNAFYGAASFDLRPVTATLELKSNRNFYAVPASVDPSRAGEFSVVTYSFLPPAETFNMVDTEGAGNFNACVDGGRLRADVNVTRDLMVYAQGIYAYTKSEQTGGRCDQLGHTLAAVAANQVQDTVWDGIAGLEWYFNHSQSHVYVWTGARDDTKEDGSVSYREHHVEYSIAKHLRGPWSIEIQGRHRHRREAYRNSEAWWGEGETYVAVKMAPQWVFTPGFEYTTFGGEPPLYFNGAVLYKFTSSSNVRVSFGQQRGAFRCASGVCRYFPPFEGARAELTWRF